MFHKHSHAPHRLVGPTFFLMGIFLVSPACSDGGSPAPSEFDKLQPLSLFQDCNQVEAHMDAMLQQAQEMSDTGRHGGNPAAAAESSTQAPDILTNTQEAGVDEADDVKVGSHHIFVVRSTKLIVLRRTDLSELGQLDLAQLARARLFVDGNVLVLLGQQWGKGGLIRFFRLEAGKMPTLLHEHALTEGIVESRVLAHRLVVVTKTHLRPESEQASVPAGTACARIYKPPQNDLDFSFTTLSSWNVLSPSDEPKRVSLLGNGDRIYMTRDNIYLTKELRAFYEWDVRPSLEDFLREQVIVTKVAFSAESGDFKAIAVGAVPGRVKDVWAFREFSAEGALAIASTTGQLLGEGSQKAANHLWVLRQNRQRLEVAASVNDFGLGEDIRSVRYVGEMAYVVTFRKTDPLFAIDMSAPLAPRMLGELEIPGFSTYMHPGNRGQLIGVGFDATDEGSFGFFQGVQVSLFDVLDPKKMRRTANIVLGARGTSSEATLDHHAFYFDPSEQLLAIPMLELERPEGSANFVYGMELVFSGAVFFHLKGEELEEQARISHAEWIPQACLSSMARGAWWESGATSMDVRRIFKVDGRILTVSAFGAQLHRNAAEEPLFAMQFSNPEAVSCQPRGYFGN